MAPVPLHYRENLFGGHTSEQDDPGFFMSPDGKTDPRAEARCDAEAVLLR